ncbi:acylneuraminate cytidylyltransferase family protein [Desulfovibrio psychrotolerans]|uniref:Acylneuraminate cytidylyltransferase n=1 Tax=Desulfovibrio psychrotolerans TaxID=415242 RepID=A0A7J0BVZ3_9BACT|nr:hypothetical protein [Desulfovibrio psychrotolerans]GFM37886.1 hypothetical protein DSM19430T_25700 [Desulfovibrio psychrotolerans]
MSDMKRRQQEVVNHYFRNTEMPLTDWRARFSGGLSKTVVQIPARAGSTRVADKNIREVCGLPLMAYSILIARALPGVDRVVVNTDSPRYAEIARHYGAEVPFLRPAEFATARCSSYWAYFYLLRHLVDEEYPVRTIITLAPTNPFRNRDHLARLVSLTQQCGSVQSAFRTPTSRTALFRPCDADTEDASKSGKNGRTDGNDAADADDTTDAADEGGMGSAKAAHGTNHADSAAQTGTAQGHAPKSPPRRVHLHDPEQTFFKPLGHFSGRNVFPAHITHKHMEFVSNPLELIDIDTEHDLALAHSAVAANLYDFGIPL